jgi:serpin B
LANAVYFNAAWASKFDQSGTSDHAFHRIDQSTVTVPMMRQLGTFNHTRVGEADAIELLYDGQEVSMVIIVPHDLPALEAALDVAYLARVDANLAPTQVDLRMPKFEVESAVSLTRTLQNMGMRSAFAPDADFSAMSDTPLAITDVLHKAMIKLDENGTEAAAATAVVAGATFAPPVPLELTIDRPFIYLIRDIETKTVIFAGRIVDPS